MQCLAVRAALHCPSHTLQPTQFVQDLVTALQGLHNSREEDQQ